MSNCSISSSSFALFSFDDKSRLVSSIEKIFINIVKQAIKYHLVDGTTFYTDSTHKKASANKNKYDEVIEEVIKERKVWLEEEINEERRKNGYKEFEYKDETEKKLEELFGKGSFKVIEE